MTRNQINEANEIEMRCFLGFGCRFLTPIVVVFSCVATAVSESVGNKEITLAYIE
jgi:hypothetical protein